MGITLPRVIAVSHNTTCSPSICGDMSIWGSCGAVGDVDGAPHNFPWSSNQLLAGYGLLSPWRDEVISRLIAEIWFRNAGRRLFGGWTRDPSWGRQTHLSLQGIWRCMRLLHNVLAFNCLQAGMLGEWSARYLKCRPFVSGERSYWMLLQVQLFFHKKIIWFLGTLASRHLALLSCGASERLCWVVSRNSFDGLNCIRGLEAFLEPSRFGVLTKSES